METQPLLEVRNLTVRLSGTTVLEDVSFSVRKGEQIAIIGASGSGKTTLIRTLTGKYFTKGSVVFANDPKIVTITQQHQFRNLSNLSSFYYQQRFNAADADDAATVNDALLAGANSQQAIDDTLRLLGISHVQFTRLIQLSNGEHKRFQLAKALLGKAQWILLDNPYTGLDAAARALLNTLLDTLAARGVCLLLVTSPADVPSCISHVATLENGKLTSVVTKEKFENDKQATSQPAAFTATVHQDFRSVPSAYPYTDFSVAVKMVGTNVSYNDRKILDNIHWEVKKGECWNVSGHNGSGKSTLLSLVNGDNPQAFANEIYLFDKKKGSGESIWDIKQKIGYISPELHHYFESGASCFEVVASGLFDTIGLFRQLSALQQQITLQWMELLEVKHLSRKLFKQLSNGEQRLVLLARALVKNPPLLILDEPCQGLDKDIALRFIALINTICVNLEKTLIYVSHYDEEIPPCVTHTLKLNQGKIAA